MPDSEFSLTSAIKFVVDEKSIQQVNRTVNSIKGFIGKALGAIGIGFSLKALNAAVEEFRSINLSLESAVGSLENMDEVQEKILKTSKDVLGNYEDIAKNVGDLIKNNRTLFDVDNATRFTDIMTKLTKLSGGSNAEASGLISSMATSMKNGKFDSGSLEALFARAPQAIKILTDYYGVSERHLRTMAQAGILKAKDIQKAFLDAGESVDKAFADLEPKITDVLSSARSELKYFIAETDEMFGITKEIAKFLREGIQVLMGGLQKLRSGVIFLSQKLGGMQNTLKLLAVIAAAFAVAMNMDKIIGGVKTLLGLFSKVGIKGMFLIGIITLIILLVEDFYHFMKGNRSLLGNVLQKLGIDADEVRKKIKDTWENIKNFFKGVWKKVQDWWDKNGGSLKKSIFGFIRGTARFVKSVIDPIKEWWDRNGEELLGKIGDLFTETKDVIIKIGHDLEDFWDQHGAQIIELACGAFEALVDAGKGVVSMLGDLWDILVKIFQGDWSGVWESLKNLKDDFLETLDNIFDDLYDTELGKKLFDWGDEIAHNFINGFKHFFDSDKKNILNIVNLARQLVGKDKLSYEEYWGETDPDAAKAADADTIYNVKFGKGVRNYTQEEKKAMWGENYENAMWWNLSEREALVQLNAQLHPNNNPTRYWTLTDEGWKDLREIQDLAEGMSYMQDTMTVTPKTANSTIDSHDKTVNINQTVDVSQTFNGDTAAQRNMKKAADSIAQLTTGQMARGMEFSR